MLKSMTQQLTECTNCNKETDTLIYLENGWDFWACPECAEWCKAVEATEATCPVLFAQIIDAQNILEVRLAISTHAETECSQCFRLTSPQEMPELQPIQAKPIQPSIPEFKKSEVA